jgi:hypothetical protein
MSVRNIVGQGPGYFLTVNQVPGIPQGLRVFDINRESFSVSWTGASGATSYTAFAEPTTKYSPPIAATRIVGTQADWENLENGETYLVIIYAVNAAGQTASFPINVTTESPAFAPNPPTALDAPAPEVHPDGFDLYFTPGVVDVSHGFATSFLGIATDPITSNQVQATGTSAPLLWSLASSNGLAAATAYDVIVRGVNSVGTSVDSSSISVTTGPAGNPTAPVITEFTNITTSAFTCLFTGGSNADTHTGLATAGSNTYQPISISTSNATGIAQWTTLPAETSYSVVITARNGAGGSNATPSAPSTVVTDFPPPLAPTITSISNVTAGAATNMRIFFSGVQGFQDTSGNVYSATATQSGTGTQIVSGINTASYVGGPGTNYLIQIGAGSNVGPNSPVKGALYDVIVTAATANAGSAQSGIKQFTYPV